MPLTTRLVAAFLVAAPACSALAQSSPHWTLGYVPSPTEWNNQWASKQDHNGQPLNLKADCGAIGDGVADDSAALKTCINKVSTSYASNVPLLLYVPTGIYKITGANGTMPCFGSQVPGAVAGDGQHKSYLRMDATYTGSLFCWTDAWEGTSGAPYNPGPFVPSLDKAGPYVTGVTISGSLNAGGEQIGLAFYDHNDHVLVENVDIFFTPGPAITMGQTLNDAGAYTRESKFQHVKMWFNGSASKAAFVFSAVAGGTGDIDVDDIQIYAFSSAGLTFTAPTVGATIGTIRLHQLRVEGNENGSATGNNVNVGLSTDLGLVSGIHIEQSALANPSGSHSAFSVDADSSVQPFDVWLTDSSLVSTLGGGGNGLTLNNVRNFQFSGELGGASGTYVTLGAHVGTGIYLDGYGQSGIWSYSISGNAPYGAALSDMRQPAQFWGHPGTSGNVGTAALHGSGSSTSAIRLTADGAAANASNCFNPTFAQSYNLSVQLLAQDVTTFSKNYSWTMPVAYFAAPSGAGTATLTAGTPATVSNGTLSGSSVSFSADTTNGCLNLSWTPPSGNSDTWDVTALITFARAS